MTVTIRPLTLHSLQGYREKLYMRCRVLKKGKLLKDVFTDCGDVTVVFELDGEQETKVVHSEKEIDKIEAELQAERQITKE